MRKALTLSLAATTALSAVAFSTAAAAYDYRDYGRHYSSRHHDNGDVAGAAIAAGVIGLVLGAALASSSSNHHYYDNGYYGRGYNNYGGYGGYGYSQPYYGSGYYGGDYGRYGYSPDYGGGGYGYNRCYTTRSWDPYYDGYVTRRVCR
ncbi:MAG: hypothetical protein ACM3W4_08180 [Ignavibacteriales bacterium]